MKTEKTITDAIAESQIRDRIVTLERTAELAAELDALADDSCDSSGITEYWGHDEDGDWRIHLDDGSRRTD